MSSGARRVLPALGIRESGDVEPAVQADARLRVLAATWAARPLCSYPRGFGGIPRASRFAELRRIPPDPPRGADPDHRALLRKPEPAAGDSPGAELCARDSSSPGSAALP